jgi:DNA-binding transcriptional regulator YhcF (GntR family)
MDPGKSPARHGGTRADGPPKAYATRARFDAIAEDIAKGRLSAGDRLPPQRSLAQRIGVDFTTVARGYVEAQKRGHIGSTVGRGTFVLGRQSAAVASRSIEEPTAGAR